MKFSFKALTQLFGWKFYNHVGYYHLHLKNGVFPKRLNLKSPTTFNEKIIYLKFNERIKDAAVYADKFRVRDFVQEKVGTDFLVPMLGCYKNPDDIDFEQLPNSFVMKANHGSGWNYICKDRSKIDVEEVRELARSWLKLNFYDISGEYQYRDIPPRIVIEELLMSDDGSDLKDYKVFCFGGEPKFIQVDIDRYSGHTRCFYDADWKSLPFTLLYPRFDGQVDRPESLAEMIRVSRELSAGFGFVRVDLYSIGSRIYFGELTLFHGSGFEPVTPKRFDKILGDCIDLH